MVQRLLRGYGGKNTRKVTEYIQNQLKEDRISDQISLTEYKDPFTGSQYQAFANGRSFMRLETLLVLERAMPAYEIFSALPGIFIKLRTFF